jgi:hypothetical protein
MPSLAGPPPSSARVIEDILAMIMFRRTHSAVTPPLNAEWRTSSRSADGNCVQVAYADDTISVRHSKDVGGPVLAFTPAEWAAFTAGVRGGEFDLG